MKLRPGCCAYCGCDGCLSDIKPIFSAVLGWNRWNCYRRVVKYSDITPEQARILKRTIDAQLNFYARLQKRLDRRGIPDDDFSKDAMAASDAVHRLSVLLHYAIYDSKIPQALPPKVGTD